ncbi:MAG: hypothetical protein QOJ00_1966 [Actinomycetota bacterium]
MDDANRVWADSMPDVYERLLVPAVFEPFAVDISRRAVSHGARTTLELAAGTGVVTRLLIASGVPNVTATDFNAAMVDAGGRAAPGAQWRQADATNLPFDDASFELVLCQFGVMFFPDKLAAFAEAARVLTPGGAFIFNVWDTVETHEFAAALRDGLRHAYPDDPPTFIESIPHGYADPAAIENTLVAAGFTSVAADRVVLDGEAASADDVARGFCGGTPVRSEIDARDGDVERAITAVTDVIVERLGAGRVSGSMAAFVFDARR